MTGIFCPLWTSFEGEKEKEEEEVAAENRPVGEDEEAESALTRVNRWR